MSSLQPTATHCHPLQPTTTQRRTLQHAATSRDDVSVQQWVAVRGSVWYTNRSLLHGSLWHRYRFRVQKHTDRRHLVNVLHRRVRWLRHSVSEFTQETREFYRYRGRVRWLRWVDYAERVVVDLQNWGKYRDIYTDTWIYIYIYIQI